MYTLAARLVYLRTATQSKIVLKIQDVLISCEDILYNNNYKLRTAESSVLCRKVEPAV